MDVIYLYGWIHIHHAHHDVFLSVYAIPLAAFGNKDINVRLATRTVSSRLDRYHHYHTTPAQFLEKVMACR